MVEQIQHQVKADLSTSLTTAAGSGELTLPRSSRYDAGQHIRSVSHHSAEQRSQVQIQSAYNQQRLNSSVCLYGELNCIINLRLICINCLKSLEFFQKASAIMHRAPGQHDFDRRRFIKVTHFGCFLVGDATHHENYNFIWNDCIGRDTSLSGD